MTRFFYRTTKHLALLVLLMQGSLLVQGQPTAFARSVGQQTPRTTPATRPLKDILNEWGRAYNVNLLFAETTVAGLTVSPEAIPQTATLEQRLDALLKPFKLGYRKRGKAYLITTLAGRDEMPRMGNASVLRLPETMPAPGPSTAPISVKTNENNISAAPQATVAGRVTSETNEGFPGVSVVLKGSGTGTVTDATGAYSVKLPQENTGTLVFSYIGYATQEVAVNNRTTIDVSLVPDMKSLNEVVVVGYGTQQKDKLTGAIGEIKAAEIAQSPAINVTNSLIGRVPGLITVQRTGEPGSDGADIFIRGIGTNGITSPLYVIDGIPRTGSDFAQINPNEIESVNILKDAASAAVFGVRGGNGVILVTTKRGQTGQTTLSYSFNYGVQRSTRLPDFLNSFEYAQLKNEGLKNVGKPELYTTADLNAYRDGTNRDKYPSTDWVNLSLRRQAPQSQHNLSLNGGNDKVRYFVNLGYADQRTLYNYDDYRFNRYNIRSNIDVAATKTTQITVDLSGRIQTTNMPTTGVSPAGGRLADLFTNVFKNLPTDVGQFSNGNYAVVNSGANVLSIIDPRNGYARSNNNQFLGRLVINQEIPFVPGLSVKAIAAYDRGNFFDKTWQTGAVGLYSLSASNDYVLSNPRPRPVLAETQGQNQRVTLESHLNYTRSFGRHNVGGLLVYSQQSYSDNYTSAYREGFISAAIDQLSVGGSDNQRGSGGASQNAIQGVVGRVNYDYNSKYLLEASFRYDGSANFPKATRWGFFPSVSAGWVVSDEDFLKNSSLVSFLKLRGSIGLLGNDQLPVGNFFYVSRYQFGRGYPFGGETGPSIYQGSLPNANITWEKIRKSNIGIEGRFLGNALSASVDYFDDHRTDILGSSQLAVPLTFGASLPVENIATIDNRGVELALAYQHQVRTGFRYFVRGNLTFARNKQVFINEPTYTAGSAAERNQQTGRSLNQQFGYRALGLFQTIDEVKAAPKQFGFDDLAPGDIRYEDVNGDGEIDANDIVQIGRSNIPEVVYGLTGGVQFKGIELTLLFQGATNVDFNYASYFINDNAKYLNENLDRWTPTNTGATFPRIAPQGSVSFQNNSQTSSWYVNDASYMRLKNVELAYTIPRAIGNKIRAKALRVFANGTNLITFSKYRFIDPENASGNGFTYPQQQVFNMGLNLQF